MLNWLVHLTAVAVGLYSLGLVVFLAGLFRRPRRDGSRSSPSVSVVIAARNEQAHIGEVLSDLTRQTYPSGKYEVIVVNDGSSDRTEEIVTRFCEASPNFHLLHATSPPPGMAPKKYALETGVKSACGEIILVTDADCRVPPTWIQTIARHFDAETGMVVGFSQIGAPGQHLSLFEGLQAIDFLLLMGAAAGSCQVGYPLAGSGQNLAYRKQAFLEVGGYRQVRHRVSGDDVLLLQLIRRQTSWRIRFAFEQGGRVVTQPQRTWRGLLNQRRRWASNGVYQYVLNRPFFLYAMATFAANALVLLGLPLGLLAGRPMPFLLAGLGKILAEWFLALRAAHIFGRKDLLGYFPLWAVLQPLYVVVVGLGGTFGRFTWKGRTLGPSMSEDSRAREDAALAEEGLRRGDLG